MARHIILPVFALLLTFACVVEGGGGGGWNLDGSGDWSDDDDWESGEGREDGRYSSSEDINEEWDSEDGTRNCKENKHKDDADEGVEEPAGGQVDPALNVRAVVGAVVGTIVLLVAVLLVVHYYKKVNGPPEVIPNAMPDVEQSPPAYDVVCPVLTGDTRNGGLPYIVPFSFEQAPASTLYPPSYSSINIRDDDTGQHTVISAQPAPMKCYGDPPKY